MSSSVIVLNYNALTEVWCRFQTDVSQSPRTGSPWRHATYCCKRGNVYPLSKQNTTNEREKSLQINNSYTHNIIGRSPQRNVIVNASGACTSLWKASIRVNQRDILSVTEKLRELIWPLYSLAAGAGYYEKRFMLLYMVTMFSNIECMYLKVP